MQATQGAGYELVSRFTTYHPPGQPRVINIRRAAQILDRTVVRAGGRFSMNEALGNEHARVASSRRRRLPARSMSTPSAAA
jgi:vancomycin resistance protein YoaR